MEEIVSKNLCTGCGACCNVCPKKAIKMVEDSEGFKYPVIDKTKCINCKLCLKTCPVLNSKENHFNIKSFACFNKNEQIRMNSSSGGIFSLIAEEVIKKKGMVFGAAFDNNYDVIHKYSNDISDFRNSKYVQSDLKNTFKEAEKFLINGKYVLFTGTTCQIEGLKKFLKKDYDKLYTQDIICHGVPSPKVWQQYLNYVSNNERITDINFRNKDKGWQQYSLKIKLKGRTYNKDNQKDEFIMLFLNNLCLRKSCYNCAFKKDARNSDITLADFWGIDNILPDMNDDKGISLVLINSQKGAELFELIKNKIEYKEVDFKEAIKENSIINNSVKMPSKRDQFFTDLDVLSIDKLYKKYKPAKVTILRRVYNKIKRIIKSN